jgi:hypothetical protein
MLFGKHSLIVNGFSGGIAFAMNIECVNPKMESHEPFPRNESIWLYLGYPRIAPRGASNPS